VRGVVALDEAGGAAVLGGDRPDFDLDFAEVGVAVDASQPGAREAEGDPGDVDQRLPGPLKRCLDGELILDEDGGLALARCASGAASAGGPYVDSLCAVGP
jgi:hypothetical protein